MEDDPVKDLMRRMKRMREIFDELVERHNTTREQIGQTVAELADHLQETRALAMKLHDALTAELLETDRYIDCIELPFMVTDICEQLAATQHTLEEFSLAVRPTPGSA